MKDFLGKELNIGDEVVFMQVGYRSLMKGVIKSMGKQKATIAHEPTGRFGSNESIQFHKQIVKIKK